MDVCKEQGNFVHGYQLTRDHGSTPFMPSGILTGPLDVLASPLSERAAGSRRPLTPPID